MTWWAWALIAAVSAAAVSIFAKLGMSEVPSHVATAVRVVVVVVFAWGVAALSGETKALATFTPKTWLFLALSGLGTGVSWLAYFKALKMAPASSVAPIDKLSLAFTLVFAVLFLKEALTWQVAVGTAFIVAGALVTVWK